MPELDRSDDSAARQIAQWCDEFESRWSVRQPLDEFARCALSFVRDSPLLRRLALELAWIDMELRWRAWDSASPSLIGKGRDTIVARWNCVPTEGDYREVLETLLGPDILDDLTGSMLAECAFTSRCLYGDLPHPHLFPSLTAEVVSSVLSMVDRLSVSLYEDGRLSWQGASWGRLTGGRRRRGEPEPFEWTKDVPPKIVIASRSNRRISRNQFCVETFSRRCAVVSNPSHNRVILVDRSIQLAPGGSLVVSPPFDIRLESLELHFERGQAGEREGS